MIFRLFELTGASGHLLFRLFELVLEGSQLRILCARGSGSKARRCSHSHDLFTHHLRRNQKVSVKKQRLRGAQLTFIEFRGLWEEKGGEECVLGVFVSVEMVGAAQATGNKPCYGGRQQR